MEDTIKSQYLKNLIEAVKECKEMLDESRAMNEETRRLLESHERNPLDYPRQARVNYTESGADMSDSPLALFVRLLKPTQNGS